MSREVRRVPANWRHPTDDTIIRNKERHIPMYQSSYEEALREWIEETVPGWIEGRAKWAEGLIRDHFNGGWKPIPREEWAADKEWTLRYGALETWESYAGTCVGSPDPKHYMPDWPEAERTHWQMYETTSEGTPISPVMPTPEDLAHWLADNGASAFGGMTATYEQWLAMIYEGHSYASAVVIDGEMMSGVEAVSKP